jgi:hypothetical protein
VAAEWEVPIDVVSLHFELLLADALMQQTVNFTSCRLEASNTQLPHLQRSHDSASSYLQHSQASSGSHVQRSHDSATTYVQQHSHSHTSTHTTFEAAEELRRFGTASTDSLALPEESISPFFGQRPAPAGYQGPLPVFSMPQQDAAGSPRILSSHAATYSPATVQPVGGLEAYTPFPGMSGPGWGAGRAGGGAPETTYQGLTASSSPSILLASAGSTGSSGSGSAAKPLGLGLGAFGLGGGLWGTPSQDASTAADAWGDGLGAKRDKEAEYGGIGKAALSKLWE